MSMVTPGEYIKDRFNEVFEIDHGKASSLKHHYDTHFHVHAGKPEHWKDHGGISTAEVPGQGRLVRIMFDTTFSADEASHHQLVEQQLATLREMLENMVHEGEACRLFVEERPEISDTGGAQRVVYHAKGIIGPIDLMPAA